MGSANYGNIRDLYALCGKTGFPPAPLNPVKR